MVMVIPHLSIELFILHTNEPHSLAEWGSLSNITLFLKIFPKHFFKNIPKPLVNTKILCYNKR